MPSDFDVNAYLNEILKDAASSLPKEQVEAAKAVLAHEKVAPRVKETVLMRSDYSRAMDQERQKEQDLQKKIQETEQFYQSQVLADHNNREAFQKLQTELQTLRSQHQSSGYDFLDPDNSGERKQSMEGYITKDEFEKEQKKLQEQALELISKTNFLSTKHFQEFGEALDPKQWYQHAISKGLPLDVAYDSFTADLRAKKAEETHKAELAKAREEGAMEALSKHKLPLVDTRPRGIHALRPPENTPKDHNSRVEAATQAYLRGES